MTFPLSFSQPKPPIRVIPIGDAVFTLNLTADDPEFIVLEASTNSFSTSVINLPSKAAIGKVFKFALVTDPISNPTLTTQYVSIFFPVTRGSVTSSSWRVYSGQLPVFVFGLNGWVCNSGSSSANVGATNQNDISIGSGANGSNAGVALGFFSNGSSFGASVGSYADGSGSGTAIGYSAAGTTSGTAIGYGSYGVSNGTAVGYNSNGYSNGAAVGVNSNGSTQGACSGANAIGSNYGAAVGYSANGDSNGAALAFRANTNAKDKAVALGYYSKAQRYREMVKGADGASTALQSWSMVNWYGDTADATATEILLGGTAAQYCLLLNNSAFMFSMQIIAGVTAGGNTSSWTIMGAIKRGATAASTALVGVPAIVMTGQDAGASLWAVAVTADTTNGSLKLTVTGAAATTIRWNAAATLSEMRF